MGTLAETAIIDHPLSFAVKGKQTSVFRTLFALIFVHFCNFVAHLSPILSLFFPLSSFFFPIFPVFTSSFFHIFSPNETG
jgi:hypothetical protein